MTLPLDLASLQALDQDDPLRPFKNRFLIPEDVLYLNGNSLGPLTVDAKQRLTDAVSHEWGTELIRGWNTAGWYDMPKRVGDKIGKLIGAESGETLLCDSTSVNLFKAVSAALSLTTGRKKIVSESGNFPTDLYILDGIKSFLKGDYQVDVRPREDIFDAIDEETAVVVLTHVHYVTGDIFPMEEITAKAHKCGALIVWDLSHSVGAVKTTLSKAHADFAVGCGYKHLNGGPGAPAFIYAAKRHHHTMHQPLSGWFSHINPFEFTDKYQPADDAHRLLCGTTPILGATALEAAVDLFLEADGAVRLKKLEQMSRIFEGLIEEKCGSHDLTLVSPADPTARGAHLSYHHKDGYALMQNLIDRGVIGDFRAPSYLRFGLSPLFMGYEDLYNAAEILSEILETGSFKAEKYQVKQAVT